MELCPKYIDHNTSSIVYAYALPSFVLITRYTECISELNETAEGSWNLAYGKYNKENSHITIESKYGFHESGYILDNTIEWSNKELWTTYFPSKYFLSNKGKAYFIEDNYTVYDDYENYVGILNIKCDNVEINGKIGKLKGDFIIFSDSEIWEAEKSMSNGVEVTSKSIKDRYNKYFSYNYKYIGNYT